MSRFNMTFNIVQTVTRKIKMEVDARDEDDAIMQAEKALEEYPREILTSSIQRMVSVRDDYEAPVKVEVVDIREDKRFG